INLMKACEKYVESIPFLPYVYKMAANRVIDEYRKMRTRNNLIDDNFGQVLQSNDDDNATVDYNDPAAKTPEAVAETDDMLTVAYHMLSRLPDEQRESFVLYALGHNMREIADLTDVNTETAKSRVRYAVNKLRPDLERLKRE
ncbi:MAG: RNA polymerase sigma factor, partial [Gammaproteobacteria bacterium]